MKWMTIIMLMGIADPCRASMVDPDATPETKALYINLKKVSDQRVLFGHQHSTCYGIDWMDQPDRSDVKTMTGSYPAVYGWDMGHTGTDHMAQLMIDAFTRGGINTISWHMDHPVRGDGSYFAEGDNLKDLLPGGAHHDLLKKELDKFADFSSSLFDAEGRLIPIIFRPWHEHTGGWFWWGSKSSTPEEFIKLWEFTVAYLRDVKGVHNLIWAYSPSGNHFKNETEYEQFRFPGYDYMDILGFDDYCGKEELDEVTERCGVVTRLARKHDKVSALTEFGYKDGLSYCDDRLWFSHLLASFKMTPDAGGVAYALTWRNGDKGHFWVPYKGQMHEEDFKRFALDRMIIFERDLPNMYLVPEGL